MATTESLSRNIILKPKTGPWAMVRAAVVAAITEDRPPAVGFAEGFSAGGQRSVVAVGAQDDVARQRSVVADVLQKRWVARPSLRRCQWRPRHRLGDKLKTISHLYALTLAVRKRSGQGQ